MPRGVTVALPVYRVNPDHLRGAVRCIQNQTLTDLAILLIPNGADEPTTRLCHALATEDPRIRVLSRPTPSLATALNAALREAPHNLVARMDADDLCPPERLERQAAFMAANPGVVALGTAFERIGPDGRVLGLIRPPTDPAEIRWRLCLGNVFCHGSMLLRRDAVLAAGGYNPACRRGQDYELWLRLSRRHDLANLPDVLYQHRAANPGDPDTPDDVQASTAAAAMLDAWRSLPEAGDADGLLPIVAAAHAGRPNAQALAAAYLTANGPSRQGLMAYLLAGQGGGTPASVLAACRVSRLRDVGRRLAGAGVRSVYLYGAGRHSVWLLAHRDDLGLPVHGVVDDFATAPLNGLPLLRPDDLRTGDHVLLSSDYHEDQLWTASEPLRRRGVRVWRLYGEQASADC